MFTGQSFQTEQRWAHDLRCIKADLVLAMGEPTHIYTAYDRRCLGEVEAWARELESAAWCQWEQEGSKLPVCS